MTSLPVTNRPSRRWSSNLTHATPGVSRGRLLLLLALGLLVTIGEAKAVQTTAPVEIESVRIGFGADNARVLFKVGCWTPVRVQLRAAGADRVSGFLEILVPDDDGVTTSFRQAVELTPGETKLVTGYARPGGLDAEFAVRVTDPRGYRLAEASQERIQEAFQGKDQEAAPAVIAPDTSLILTLGQPRGIDQIMSIPGFSSADAQGSQRPNTLSIASLTSSENQMPGRWYGLDAARTIVIDTDDRAAMQAIEGLKGQPLVDWVQRGGHLVVCLGENWQVVRESVLGSTLPAVPAGQERVPSLDAIDTFAASNKPITPPGTPRVMVSKLEEVTEHGGKVLSITGNLPLIVRGAYGFGRVTLVGIGISQNYFSDWPDRGLFWARVLDLRGESSDQAAEGGTGTGRFYQSGITDLSSQLRVALEQFPGVKLIPFGWVAFLIFLYILLIGPGDYFFLKRIVKRMELTWITFPLIVSTVSLAAYFASYRLKGNDLLINKVDVVDVDQTAGIMRGRTILSLFSPRNHDYTIGFAPPATLDQADASPYLTGKSAQDGSSLPPGMDLQTSWFSVPEQQFGSMGGRNRRFSFLGGGYFYQPAGGVEKLENVRVPIWSTRAVTARWFGPASAPLVDADLRPVGTDRLMGRVVNRCSYPLDDAILAFGKQVYLLGTIEPGATVNIELTGDRNLSGLLRDRTAAFNTDQPDGRDAKISKADLLLTAMFRDSEGSRNVAKTLSNYVLGELDLTGQLAIDRPMLVARVKLPGAQVTLNNPPSEPKVDQTTMLRVILPLNRTRPEPRRTTSDASSAAGREPNASPR